jgi:16S rRNA (guanine527-N7)-methyltransferase
VSRLPLFPSTAVADRLQHGLQALALTSLPDGALAQWLGYLEELHKWSAAYNLTAIRQPLEMVDRHLLDSLAVLPVLDALAAGRAVRVLDVGAGAGLPCIPLAIARPQWQVTGLDSNGKKARFMRHAGRALSLGNFQVIEGRAEDIIDGEAPFDLITSRAFASLGEFFAHTDHRLAADGVWVALKAKLTARELAQIPPQVALDAPIALKVPGVDESRHALIARLKSV